MFNFVSIAHICKHMLQYTVLMNSELNRKRNDIIMWYLLLQYMCINLPRMETLLRNSSYIFLFLSVLPCKTKDDIHSSLRAHSFCLHGGTSHLVEKWSLQFILKNIWIIINDAVCSFYPPLPSSCRQKHCKSSRFHTDITTPFLLLVLLYMVWFFLFHRFPIYCNFFCTHMGTTEALFTYQMAFKGQKLTNQHW